MSDRSGIKIIGTGSYLPASIVSNDDMAKLVDTNDEWISSRTGIRTRHFTGGEPTSYMALCAARQALERAGTAAEAVDMIVCSTITPDCHTPSVSSIVQGQLGAKNAFCLDISSACTGFVNALDLAQKYLSCGAARTALVLSAETLSHISNFEDRSTCVLFGDGAGACVVQGGEGRYASFLGCDGTGVGALYATSCYGRTPFEAGEDVEARRAFDCIDDGFIHMDGKEVYKFSTAIMPRAIREACGRLGIAPEEIDWIIPHQANVRIIRTGMKNLGLPMEKAYCTIDNTGNTSSASIPIALDEAVRKGCVREGNTVAVVGFGAGLTYGAAIFDW